MSATDFSLLIAAIDAKARSLASSTTDSKDLVFLGKMIEAIENATALKPANNLSDILDAAAARVNLGLPFNIQNPQADHTLVFNAALNAFVSTVAPKEITTLTRDPLTTDTQFAPGDVIVNTATGRFWVCVGTSESLTLPRQFRSSDGDAVGYPQGQQLFLNENWTSHSSTNYASFANTFTVPAGVESLSAVLVGGGGGGNPTWSSAGGGGGALAWANDIPVTPGETLTIVVGHGGAQSGNGGATILYRGSSAGTVLFSAQGGIHSAGSVSQIAAPVGGAITPGNINSGRGGLRSSATGTSGGGGAGGYTGNGGNGAYGLTFNNNNTFNSGGDGTGGAASGGGGYESSTYGFGGGGGVGVWGQGASGTFNTSERGNNFTNQNYSGRGGSGGENGGSNSNTTVQTNNTWGLWDNNSKTFASLPTDSTTPTATRAVHNGQGGLFGGGGGGSGTSMSNSTGWSTGGPGGARIIWGGGRSFPATRTGDEPVVTQ